MLVYKIQGLSWEGENGAIKAWPRRPLAQGANYLYDEIIDNSCAIIVIPLEQIMHNSFNLILTIKSRAKVCVLVDDNKLQLQGFIFYIHSSFHRFEKRIYGLCLIRFRKCFFFFISDLKCLSKLM